MAAVECVFLGALGEQTRGQQHKCDEQAATDGHRCSKRGSTGRYLTPMRMATVPRTRWGRVRMLAIAAFLPLLFLFIWLFTVKMPGPTFTGALPPPTPDQARLRVGLERHVRALAQDIGVRSDQTYHSVERAAAYIERTLTDLGYRVVPLEYSARGLVWRNLEATLVGAGRPQQVVVIGAHYDTAEEAPGADDNASGVAGAAGRGRLFSGAPPARTTRFVVFPNQKPPPLPPPATGSPHHPTA